MSYLKIFPRSLVAKADGSGAYTGRMTYDFEQYGRMLYDNETGVTLEYQLLVCSGWSIRLTGAGQGLAGLSVFIHAMNYYLFSVLQFDPVSHWSKRSDKDYEFTLIWARSSSPLRRKCRQLLPLMVLEVFSVQRYEVNVILLMRLPVRV
jgi:hypothetical protein